VKIEDAVAVVKNVEREIYDGYEFTNTDANEAVFLLVDGRTQEAVAYLENAYRHRPRRQAAAVRFRKARRARGARSGSIGRERPAWQRDVRSAGLMTPADRATRSSRGALLPMRMRPAREHSERRAIERRWVEQGLFIPER
jgi:hypothetical protein